MRENTLPEVEQRSRVSRRALIIAVQVVLGLAVIVAVSIGLWDQAQLPANDIKALGAVPTQIGGISRTEVVTGAEALADLKQMHGKDVSDGLVGGWIGHYGKQATVWLSEARDDATASRVLQAMTSRIGAGNQYFKNQQDIQVNGRQVYTATGQGQRHYYYQQGRQVIWVAAPAGREEQFLKEALLGIK